MLRRLLREDGAERAFLEKLDIFQQNPGLLEKYLIGSEVSLAVLDLFLTRLFGSEGISVNNAKEVVESVKADLGSPRVSGKRGSTHESSIGRRDEHCPVVEALQQQVLDLTRQFSAIHRQFQMHGEVSQLAASIDSRIEEVTSACKRRVEETNEALRDIGELKKELGLKASAEDLKKLVEEVSRIKDVERQLDSRLEDVASALEGRVADTEHALRAEIRKVDVSSQLSDVARDLGEMKKELALRASSEDLKQLVEEASRLKEAELRFDGRLEEVTRACERRVTETNEALLAEIRKVDVSSQLSDVVSDLGELKKELALRASSEDLKQLVEEASRLKEVEQRLNGRISVVETKATECDRLLWAEIQGKIERLDMKGDPLDGIISRLTRECG